MVEQRYKAVHEFEALNPISGRKQRVMPGDVFYAELGQREPTIMIRLGESLWLVEYEVFKQCCTPYGLA